MIKPSRKAFLIAALVLLGILILYGTARIIWGPLLPPVIDKNLPDALVVGGLVILVWNRQVRGEEARNAAAAKKAAEEAAASEASEAPQDQAGKEAASPGNE